MLVTKRKRGAGGGAAAAALPPAKRRKYTFDDNDVAVLKLLVDNCLSQDRALLELPRSCLVELLLKSSDNATIKSSKASVVCVRRILDEISFETTQYQEPPQQNDHLVGRAQEQPSVNGENKRELKTLVASSPTSKTTSHAGSDTKSIKKKKGRLLKNERHAIRKYTGNSYATINRSLRNGKPLDSKCREQVESIRQGLSKLPPFVGTVYRATDLGPELVNKLQVHSTFSDPAFLSTSKKNFVDFYKFMSCKCRFTIASKTGKDISPYATNVQKEEAEILFLPNTRFRVTSIERKDDGLVLVAMEEEMVV